MKLIGILFVLALAGGGCAGGPKIGEPEKHLVDQSKKGAVAAIADLEPVVGMLDTSHGMALAGVKAAIAKLRVINANQEQLQAVVKPPEQPEEYSEETSRKKRDESKASQSGGFWTGVGGVVVAAAGIAWAILKQTQLGQLATQFVETGMNLRMKAKQGALTEEDIKGGLAAANAVAPPAIKKRIEETVVRVKKKLNGALKAPTVDAAAPHA